MNLIIQFISLGIIFFIASKLLRRNQELKLNEPPLVPYKLPIIGHTFDFYRNTEKFLAKCAEEYGETFSLYIFGKIETFVGSRLSPEVFKSDKDFNFDIAFKEKFPLEAFMDRADKYFAPLPRIIFTYLSQQLPSYTERVQRTLTKAIKEQIGDGTVLQPPLKTFQLIIARPIAASLLGEELSEDKELVNTVAYASSDFIPFLSIPPFLDFIYPLLHQKFMILLFKLFTNPFKVHREVIKRKLTPVLEKRLNDMKRDGESYVPPVDILQKLIELVIEDDYKADIDIITDYVITAIFAATHTTSTFLTNATHKYANHPEIQKELLEEQERLLENKSGPYYTSEQIDSLVKLDSFFKETLRMTTSIVFFEHKALNPYTFSSGHQVPKGRHVTTRLQEVHREEESQGENPNEFNFLRHVGAPAPRVEKNFLAFSFGKHACPGRYFATSEIKTALHYLLLNYNIKTVNDEIAIPQIKGPYRYSSDVGIVFEKRKDI
ncbi:unnamed protein product [Rhizophagus irregularis]|uniref:Cytochrome P450 n=1 Tax=Rhizophagus irregularis TaxID=588596 RepID=A0A2N1NY49_9GLOM|nr:cytochrome P450 [Rhizophagus irregularis]CAB4382572.1 unnamed protein product [Rhizophagus irregularis]CAB5371716.1 unnamed protein product [Rhizophagus irregularis]